MELELAEQHHQEIQQLIRDNFDALGKLIIDGFCKLSVNNGEQLLADLNTNLSNFVSKVSDIKISTPNVNVAAPNVHLPAPNVQVDAPIVNVDMTKVGESFKNETQRLVLKIEDLLNKMPQKGKEEWDLNFYRNEDGVIISSTAKQIK